MLSLKKKNSDKINFKKEKNQRIQLHHQDHVAGDGRQGRAGEKWDHEDRRQEGHENERSKSNISVRPGRGVDITDAVDNN